MSKIRICTGTHGGTGENAGGARLAGSMRRTARVVCLTIEVASGTNEAFKHLPHLPDSRMVRLKAVKDRSVYHAREEDYGHLYVPDPDHDHAKDPAVRAGKHLIEVEMTPEQFGELLCQGGSETDCTIRHYENGGHFYREEVKDPGSVSSRLKERLQTANAGARKRVVDLVNYVNGLSGLSDKRKAEIKSHAEMILRDMGGNTAFAAEIAAEEVSQIAEAAVHMIDEKATARETLRASIGPGGVIDTKTLPDTTEPEPRKDA